MLTTLRHAEGPKGWEAIDTLIATSGSTAHPYVRSGTLLKGPTSARDIADAAHFLCVIYGHHPGLPDYAAMTSTDDALTSWMAQCAAGFAAERGYLSRLTARLGPMPSTAGQNQCEAATLAQRHALDMLGQSERRGCAFGAVLALTLDWRAIRTVLDAAAERIDLTPPTLALPSLPETVAVLDHYITPASAQERAATFGAQQLLAQHQAFWDLMKARHDARAQAELGL